MEGSRTLTELGNRLRRALRLALEPYAVSARGPRTLVLAVSGGRDSVVLMSVALSAYDRSQIVVAHFDHGLRPTSQNDARFVSDLCAKCEVRFATGSPAKPFRVGESGNLESWAREARYSFLAQTAHELDGAAIVTAHHQHDVAETVLFRMTTGRGFQGISSSWSIPVGSKAIPVVRPFLDIEAEVLAEYAKQADLTWIEDESNSDTARARNFIRHRILPELRALNPRVEESIAALSRGQRRDDAYLRTLAADWREAAGELTWKALKSCPQALLPRVLRLESNAQLKECPTAGVVSDREFELISDRIGRGDAETVTIELTGGYICSLGSMTPLSFRLGDAPYAPIPEARSQPIPGYCTLDGFGLSNAVGAFVDFNPFFSDDVAPAFQTALASEITAEGGLFWRVPCPGDSVRIAGRGTRKLKKLFQEYRIAPTIRDRYPILATENEVVWVPGVAVSERFAPLKQSSAVYVRLSSGPSPGTSN